MKTLFFKNNLAGGLGYHYIAFKFKKALWQPYLKQIDEWLKKWPTPQKELILFGCSGGYTLSKQFINRFERIYCIEPDPIAKVIFKMRFADKEVQFLEPVPFFSDSTYSQISQEFLSFIERHQDKAFLFCNLLGQLRYLKKPFVNKVRVSTEQRENPPAWNIILQMLQHVNWSSYHDVLSMAETPTAETSFMLKTKGFAWRTFIQEHILDFRKKIKILDHQTLQLAQNQNMPCTWWRRTPHYYHLIGFVSPQSTWINAPKPRLQINESSPSP